MVMRRQTCVTLDLDTHRQMIERLRDGRFRSKSHLIEYALLKFLQEGEVQ